MIESLVSRAGVIAHRIMSDFPQSHALSTRSKIDVAQQLRQEFLFFSPALFHPWAVVRRRLGRNFNFLVRTFKCAFQGAFRRTIPWFKPAMLVSSPSRLSGAPVFLGRGVNQRAGALVA